MAVASPETMSVTPRSSFRRFFPLYLLPVAGVAILIAWLWPNAELERMWRIFATSIICQLAFLLTLIWFVGFSGWSLTTRLLGIALLAAVIFGSVRRVWFTGDMLAVPEFRWTPTRLEAIQAHQMGKEKAATVQIAEARNTDFPEYRNRNRDGLVTGPPLARDWQAQPPRLLWKQPCGSGYSGIVVVGPSLFTLEQRGDDEVIVCYDTATGQERWTFAYPDHFSEPLGGEGPRATPTIQGSDLFSLGARGELVCVDAATGKLKWRRNILQDNKNIDWAMSGSPLVYDDLVVVNPGKQTDEATGKAVQAFNKDTGKPAWTAGNAQAGYSSPMLATLCGQRQVILLDAGVLAGYDPTTGKQLWTFPWDKTHQGINVAQPVVLDGDRVFISSGYSQGCAMIQLGLADGKWTTEELFRNKNMRCKFASPVYYQGHLYGLDEGILACLDPKTGERKWRRGSYGHGQLLLQDNLLVILSEDGDLVLVEATPERFKELGMIHALQGQRTWNHLALANGKAYVRNHVEMACYDLTAKEPAGQK